MFPARIFGALVSGKSVNKIFAHQRSALVKSKSPSVVHCQIVRRYSRSAFGEFIPVFGC
jgi:hypothetical protein